jgi:hypothetical protein
LIRERALVVYKIVMKNPVVVGVKFYPNQTQTYAITADVTKPANSIIITSF